MKQLKKILTVTLALCAFGTLLALTGCGAAADTEQQNCAIVYANRQNSAASPTLAQAAIEDVVSTSGYLDVIRADGSPASSIVTGTYLGSESENDSTRTYENQAQLNNALQAVYDTTAEAEEVDIVAAVEVAARSLASPKEGKNTIVIVDSGISTKGIVDFTEDGMIDADPDKFASYLKDNGLLPNLSGVDAIVWYGFSDVADEQEAMPNNAKTQMQEIYAAVFKAAGVANVSFDSAIGPTTDTPTSSLPKVTTVDMPATPKFSGAGTTVKLTQAQLSFEGNSAEFTDEAESRAKQVLSEYAEALAADKNLTVDIRGYTATTADCPNGDSVLAQQRADKVKSVLCELGADQSQITAKGMGAGPVSDRDSSGKQIETLAAQNRYVELSFN
jgi:outer membrane protein OmpA-like peptidoglycan-associated protein